MILNKTVILNKAYCWEQITKDMNNTLKCLRRRSNTYSKFGVGKTSLMLDKATFIWAKNTAKYYQNFN